MRTGRLRTILARCASATLVAGGVAGVSVIGAPAAVAVVVPSPTCASGTCQVSYATVGVGQSFTVPPGVNSLSVTLYGGKGGTNYNENVAGGDGAQVTATLSVSPGQGLGVDVGGAGGGGVFMPPGGVNGGGTGEFSGSGGGATDITSGTSSAAAPATPTTELLVAGGGGGAGANEAAFGPGCFVDTNTEGGTGGNADNPGGTGESTTRGALTLNGGGGGGPGTTSGAGSGGSGGAVTGADPCAGFANAGAAGNSGSGRTGADATSTLGGAGGGGYFGGGSGGGGASEDPASAQAGSGGGGGGASYTGGAGVSDAHVDDAGNGGSINSGNGEALFSYADPISTGPASYATPGGQNLNVGAASGLLSSTANTTGPGGDTLSASTSSGATSAGGTVSVSTDGSFTYVPPSAGFAGADSFTYTVADSFDYATGTATVNVTCPGVHGSPDASASVPATCPAPTVTNIGPKVGPVTGGTTLTITGSGFTNGATVLIGQGHSAGAGALAATAIDVVSDTEITATTPAGALGGHWHLFVSTVYGTSTAGSGDLFGYRPTITSVSPSSGPIAGGTPITITGHGFAAGATVLIGQGHGYGAGALAATGIDVVSDTEITAVTPGGARPGHWKLFVRVNGVTSQGATYTYTRTGPCATRVSPSC